MVERSEQIFFLKSVFELCANFEVSYQARILEIQLNFFFVFG